MKVKFEVKNGKFRFFILNRVLKLLLFIDHAKYKATSSEKCKKTFQQMAPLNNANFKVSPLVALRRVRITAIAVLLVPLIKNIFAYQANSMLTFALCIQTI